MKFHSLSFRKEEQTSHLPSGVVWSCSIRVCTGAGAVLCDTFTLTERLRDIFTIEASLKGQSLLYQRELYVYNSTSRDISVQVDYNNHIKYKVTVHEISFRNAILTDEMTSVQPSVKGVFTLQLLFNLFSSGKCDFCHFTAL